MQDLQILSTVVSSALGGSKQDIKPPENIEEAKVQLANVLGGGKISSKVNSLKSRIK